MSYILRTNSLIKTFGNEEVVSNVSMNIKKGEIYGFLGPNGAGKTTIMKMITNLIKPTSGEVELFGEKLTDTSYEVLKRIGTIIEYPIFYEKLTARENLELHLEYMGYHDTKIIYKSLELLNLKNIDKKVVKDFSLGMKQRLGIARAISTNPELLILDEPINGLDPIGIKELRDLFKMLCKEYGTTILISSHMLGEIEQVADTIGVINKGRLIEEVSLDSIRGRKTEYIEILTKDYKRAAFILENELNISNFRVEDNSLIKIYDLSLPESTISKTLILKDVNIEGLLKKNNSLEDYFLKLMNRGDIND